MSSNAQSTEGNNHYKVITPLLFTVTIFISAALLFFVQPLFAKIVLPHLGGAPAVWTTAMLFFQSVLIVGYIYSHLLTKYLPVTAQVGVHIVLWTCALLFIPLSIPESWSVNAEGSITIQTLVLFAVGVGMPFAFLSANAPLIQHWYGLSDGPSSDDPYFLYGASNLGSLGALLAFPLIAEPLFGARSISIGWAGAFIFLGILLGTCGFMVKKPKEVLIDDENLQTKAPPKLIDYLKWLALAFIPSSLMLSVTTHVSVDVGSFPLLWVIPLSLYLLTFVLGFRNKPLLGEKKLYWAAVLSIAAMAFFSSYGFIDYYMIPILFILFFIVALKSHSVLYRERPSKDSLTVFYIVISIGGAIGGVFNSIIAPTVFNDSYELKLTLLFCSMLPILLYKSNFKKSDLLKSALLSCMIFCILAVYLILKIELTILTLLLIFYVYLLVVLALRENPFSLSASTASFLISVFILTNSSSIFKDRSFFGVHEVHDTSDVRVYANGTTVHGKQLISELDAERPRPLSYYYDQGPFGQILKSDSASKLTDIGVVGLGVGSLACYAQPGQNWQFYEIDAAVVEIAKEKEIFTYLQQCADTAPIHLGDARVVLEGQETTKFDLLVIDAFSSDSIPIHLLTHEAMQLYLDRLKSNGILLIHISNRYFRIGPAVARSIDALGLEARIQYHRVDSNHPLVDVVDPSNTVIIARTEANLAEFVNNKDWQPLISDGKSLWTDDFANILSTLMWE